MSFGISDKSYSLIIRVLSNYCEIRKACIFGSRAMGNYKRGSDIDICIYGKKITEEIISKINFELNVNLDIPYYIDLVHYDKIENENLKKHIDDKGIRIIMVTNAKISY